MKNNPEDKNCHKYINATEISKLVDEIEWNIKHN